MTTTQQPENKNQPNRTVPELVEYIQALTTEIQELYCLDEIPWVVGYSGGKDSTATLQLIWNAISGLPAEKRTKPIHVITTDTGVENPYVSAWVKSSLKQMEVAAEEQKMPIQPHLLQPETKQTYWAGLIGKGYPAPRNKFRWCTGRLKIEPSNLFIRDVVRANGETIVILGTRKTESITRGLIMMKREAGRVRERLCPHPNLINSLLYTPIEDWRTDEVWLYLMQFSNPWGYSNKDLFTMYRGATADNECPLVVDTSTPSCGSSRFGCWVCTLVNSDKSMQAMIQNDEEKEWLQPLVDFRAELDVDRDREKRDFRRIWGEVQLFERNVNGEASIEPIHGPYTKYWREYWLRKLLTAQKEMRENAPENMRDITLISQAELSEIRRIWLEEKHEFDDSVPRIYEEVTGEVFKDPRPGADQSILGSDEWGVLEEICEGDGMHLELMARLLDTERQFKKKTRRVGIYESLEKCFDTSSRSPEKAIANAHLKRDLRQAALEGDVATIREKFKQLSLGDTAEKQESKPQTWANFKYAQKNPDDNPDQ
ncbi:DNA phosphorothioation system sulfurtransferase DndC [Dolichospermum sp. UHCC 0684]|jgi:DNA sulfur modification protein DndC|uniref:DNA phosphorothioation system sulfurtransferase DndC n=1 Tax=unclassified Dolichospermum TaxID=2622029 RepID=UPI0011E7D9EB|nr:MULTISPECIES: DNA phosphorothioation system sulfurtransferase DndC [unclassified Dolichospermum]MBO1047882.1 DNA phosphorothioation system sulfurtransferase DndC [Dolichospermum sp. DEX182a]MEA5528755.1 DNA phosphorothioation system sulfurtransferase DndC [Dolichospermum sp. UHCC 0684]MTJ17601.1 DNA phosphorothioation system sulfurtransferase DndC [Dolichospermum sp. UHCC 0299]MTJ35490.1 DNA phosphorothioation system sulfurtransferase DndC [Dolichospermum sp. UHCC 0260]MTJ38312.1 DNA phosph